MIYDRPYMQQGYSSGGATGSRPWLWYLLGSIGAGFVLQQIIGNWFGGGRFLFDWVVLSGSNLWHGKVWTVLTYGWTHGGFFHVFINLLVSFLVGRGLVQVWGHLKMARLFTLAIVGGGILYGLLHLGPWVARMPVVGASAGLFGLLALLCFMHWNRQLTFMFMFVIPLTLSGRLLFYLLVGVDLVLFLVNELPVILGRTTTQPSAIAYSAHLGGAGVAWLFWREQQNPGWLASLLPLKLRRGVKIEPPRWPKKSAADKPRYQVNLSPKSSSKDIDAILDKINKHGFGALSPEERDTLDRAHKKLRS
ncbi:MAG: rhomboid family intramembrane serine protease [Opitutales bacterium]